MALILVYDITGGNTQKYTEARDFKRLRCSQCRKMCKD